MSLVFLYAYFFTFGRSNALNPWPTAAWFDVGLFSAFALHHSVLARTGAKQLLTRVVPAALERATYTATASALFLAVCLLWRPVPGELYQLDGVLRLLGYGVQVAGIAITIAGASTLGVLTLAGVRHVQDDRLPAAAVPLRTSGLYGVVRHPLYFGWFLLVFGTPHMTMTRFVFAAVSTVYIALAIPFEERDLVGQFGDDYRRYQRTVRWRMVPGVF
jgi:protein-S-isoprenylcysteine O-methyltransferase Ste14